MKYAWRWIKKHVDPVDVILYLSWGALGVGVHLIYGTGWALIALGAIGLAIVTFVLIGGRPPKEGS